MRLFAVSGLSQTGKTTVVEQLVRVFSKQGLAVATIKNSESPGLPLFEPGRDTTRHQQAGADCAVLRGPNGVSFGYQGRLSLGQILGQLNHDVVILEGFGRYLLPKILTAASEQEADQRFCEQVFACSGLLAQQMSLYRQRPVIDCLREPERLAELAWAKALCDLAGVDTFAGQGEAAHAKA